MLKDFIKLPQSGNRVLILFILLLVWLISPYIHISGSAPFTSVGVRSFLSVLIIGGYALKLARQWFYKNQGQSIEKITTNWDEFKVWKLEFISKMKQKTGDNIIDFKERWQNDKQRRQLKKAPWYLVMGSPKSGKQHLIGNSGLRFLKPEYYGRQAVNLMKQFSDLRWHFTDEAVFVDVTQYDENANLQLDRKLIRYLRKRRRNKPISGLVLSFSLPELILATHQSRRNFLKSLADQINNLYQILKTPIPVYLVLTKADLISGFSEFFSDLSKEELSQVWGITFPMCDSSNVNSIQSFFQKEYSQLLARLQQRVLWSLDTEKLQQSRNFIYSFPQQMQLFLNPINTFLGELFAMLPRHHVLQMRGVYFTSTHQEGQPYDFFLHAIGKRYNLNSNYRISQENHEESYFVQKLFYNVIFDEHQALGFSERTQRLKKCMYRSAWVGVPLFVILGFSAFQSAYKTSQLKARLVSNNLQQYQLAVRKVPETDIDISHTLSSLNALRRAEQIYSENIGWSALLFVSHIMSSGTKSAVNRSLRTLFLPRVAANLEASLQHGRMGINTLYATLKGYLAFSPSSYTEPTAIRAPMEIEWSKIYQGNPQIQRSLRYYLKRSSNLELDELPLDSVIINRVRLELQQILPQRRAYALLTIKALASDLPSISFSSVIGDDFSHVFVKKTSMVALPALYTNLGYEKVFLLNYETITRQVSDDNKEIGLDANQNNTQSYSQIVSEIRHDYNSNYLKAWNDSLSNLSIVPFHSNIQALTVFDTLSSDHSPLTKLLTVISDNTQKVNGKNLAVASHFSKMNAFSQAGITGSDLANTLEVFQNLRDYFAKINAAANPNKAAFDSAVEYMKGDSDNPILKLSEIARSAPQPLKGWMKQLADNSWECVLQGALRQINSSWHATVMSEYQGHIAGRYPLDPHASTQLSIDGFQRFFSENGVLDTYFCQYIMPFVNTNALPWKLYALNGHSLGLSSGNLSIFEKMRKIQSLYFSKKTKQPKLRFSVVPVGLNEHMSMVRLTMGPASLIYEHGPQRPVSVSWPFDENNLSSKLVMADFSGHNQVKSSYGEWSLFRLLDQAKLSSVPHGDGYLFSVEMSHHAATFKIISDASIQAFNLRPIKNFWLPQYLGRKGKSVHE
jgi:type VI secretion system protein ImpL